MLYNETLWALGISSILGDNYLPYQVTLRMNQSVLSA